MKKILSLCLSTLLLLSLLPASAMAVDTFDISEEGVAFIKEFEGFRDMPYMDDRGRWYIGYGTSCEAGDYGDGVTEEEADELLREALSSKGADVNRLLLDYAIQLEQHQFDALVSMTYTLGTQWMNPTYRLCSYLISGVERYSEAEIVNAIATWCHVGTEPVERLVQRRLREAYLFLYGVYDSAAVEDYCYLHFDPAGGAVENQTVFYPVGEEYGALPVPDRAGYAFVGWLTGDGDFLTGEETAWESLDVTALWEPDGSAEPEEPEVDLSTWVNPYTDLAEEDWYFSVVRELSAKGVVGGYPDGTFRPENTLTAGEALKLILLAAGYGEQLPVDGHWASGYLALAQQLGCLTAGDVQSLDSPVSRRLIAQVAAVAMGLEPRFGASPFADVDDGYALALYEEKILTGSISGGRRWLHPDDSINRAETCAIVSRIGAWSYVEKNDPAQSGYVVYRDKYYPLLRDVPVCSYDTNLLVLDGSTMYYNDPAYAAAIGIDVSSHQGEIDWERVADSGVEFAIIRLGFRGYGQEGTINLDKYFQQNLEGAQRAGLKVGVYFFSQAISVEEAEEEARFVLENLAGASLDYPVVYDWEAVSDSAARTNGLDASTLTDCAIAFCEAVAREGYTPMIYYNGPVGYTRYQLSRLTDYDVWFAQYASQPTMYYDYRIWQYSDSGSVPGIDTRVDMNLAFLPY